MYKPDALVTKPKCLKRLGLWSKTLNIYIYIYNQDVCYHHLNLLGPELFFLILAHPVYKMWIIQEPNMLELWNKLHFEEEKMEIIYHV